MTEQAYKRCSQCGESKPLEAFNRNRSRADGRASCCADCRNAIRREWRRNNREKFNESKRRWRARHPEKAAQHLTKWKEANPEKRRVHKLVFRAVERGELSKPAACEECGQERELHGHHDDYTKPLEVRWLCPVCHGAVHYPPDSGSNEGER